MKQLIKLTNYQNEEFILIGTESIISVETIYIKDKDVEVSKIRSRGAMIETFFVIESVEEIYNLYNSL